MQLLWLLVSQKQCFEASFSMTITFICSCAYLYPLQRDINSLIKKKGDLIGCMPDKVKEKMLSYCRLNFFLTQTLWIERPLQKSFNFSSEIMFTFHEIPRYYHFRVSLECLFKFFVNEQIYCIFFGVSSKCCQVSELFH